MSPRASMESVGPPACRVKNVKEGGWTDGKGKKEKGNRPGSRIQAYSRTPRESNARHMHVTSHSPAFSPFVLNIGIHKAIVWLSVVFSPFVLNTGIYKAIIWLSVIKFTAHRSIECLNTCMKY
jgi:hypothetical protein